MTLDIMEILTEFDIKYKDRFTDVVVLCPFHDEKTPSLFIRKDIGIFHCFGCGRKGSFVEYFAQAVDMDLYDAMCFIDDRGKFKEDTYVRKVIANIDELHKTYLLFRHKAERYLKSRGIINPHEFECGYDNYRDSITIPVKFNGKLVGFEARSLKEGVDKFEKYKALYFPKTNYLYGWDYLDINYPFIVLVESAISVMYLKNTIKLNNSLALMGTSASDTQINLIKEIQPERIFCWFDDDEAGEKAYNRIKSAIPNSFRIRTKNDPDEYTLEEILTL